MYSLQHKLLLGQGIKSDALRRRVLFRYFCPSLKVELTLPEVLLRLSQTVHLVLYHYWVADGALVYVAPPSHFVDSSTSALQSYCLDCLEATPSSLVVLTSSIPFVFNFLSLAACL